MNYRSLINADTSVDMGYFNNGVEHVVVVRVGECDKPRTVFSVLVALKPTPLLPNGGFEFIFTIIEFDVASGTEVRHLNGKDTKAKIPGVHDRAICVGLICEALSLLLSEVGPPIIFMQTCNANLPPKARKKYEKVIEVFRTSGYHIERQPPYHGRESWVMERIDA